MPMVDEAMPDTTSGSPASAAPWAASSFAKCGRNTA